MKWHSLVVEGRLETYLVPRRFVARKKKHGSGAPKTGAFVDHFLGLDSRLGRCP